MWIVPIKSDEFGQPRSRPCDRPNISETAYTIAVDRKAVNRLSSSWKGINMGLAYIIMSHHWNMNLNGS